MLTWLLRLLNGCCGCGYRVVVVRRWSPKLRRVIFQSVHIQHLVKLCDKKTFLPSRRHRWEIWATHRVLALTISTKLGTYVKVRNALNLDNVRYDSLAEYQFTRAQYQVPTQNTSRQKYASNLTPTMIVRLYNSSHHQFSRPIGEKETFINEDKIWPLSDQAIAHAFPDLH